MEKVEDSLNQFSLSLYRNYVKDRSEENVFFSPLSIFTALSMVYAGSSNKTAAQMKEVMRLSCDPSDEDFYKWNIQVELDCLFKSCGRYIFASLFCISKREHF